MQVVIIAMMLCACGIVSLVSGNSKAKMSAKESDKKYINWYFKIYRMPLFGKRLRKVTQQVQAMSLYTKRATLVKSCKYFLSSEGAMFATLIASIFIFQDLISVLTCTALAMVLSTIVVDKKVDQVNKKVYKQLRVAVASIRQEYLRYNDVIEALNAAEYGDDIRHCFEEIISIITATNGELKLREFFERVPYRPVQTLARMCFDVNNVGDVLDESGQSNFVNSLTLMSSDINAELERIQYQESRFGKIEYLPLVVIPGMKALETFFLAEIPNTAIIYEGPIGYIFRVVILVSCIVCYTTVARINSTNSIRDDDRQEWCVNALKNLKIARFVDSYSPKNTGLGGKYSLNRLIKLIIPTYRTDKKRIYQKKLKKAISRKSIHHIYLEKLVYAAGLLLFSLLVSVVAVWAGRNYLINTTSQLTLIASDEMEDYKHEDILKMDKIYMKQRDNGKVLEGEELEQLVDKYMPDLTSFEKEDQYTRLDTKYRAVKSAYYRWWYILICIVIGILGWCIPDIMLKLRTKLVETEAEEDFLQMQMLMTIIMNTDADTLEALEQLCQISKIHRDLMLYCYNSFPSNPTKELMKLKNETPLVDFKRFVDKLELTVNDLSLRDAFSDLIIEREHILKLRQMKMQASINKKRSLCGMLSLAPLMIMVTLDMLVPIIYLGYTEFVNALNGLE